MGYLRVEETSAKTNAVQRAYSGDSFFPCPAAEEPPAPAAPEAQPQAQPPNFIGVFRSLTIKPDDQDHAEHASLGRVAIDWINPFSFHFEVGTV